MTSDTKASLGGQIIEKALEFGASLAGITNIKELKMTPSHMISRQIAGNYEGIGAIKVEGRTQGEVIWPKNAKSAVVICVEHPKSAPDMDWWIKGLKGGTKGNAELIAVFSKLADWLGKEKNIECIKLAYYIEQGAVFMKDTAVLAGLGCIGKNNMLVTPQYGPEIRLRVMMLDVELPSTGVLDFDPCTDCKEYCRKVCPQKAFNKKIYSAKKYDQDELPGRTGVYSRIQCNMEMEKNTETVKDVAIEGTDNIGSEVKFCRRCEQVCPVGKS